MHTTTTQRSHAPPGPTTYEAVSGGDAALGALALVEGARADGRLDRLDHYEVVWLYAGLTRHHVLLELAPRRFDAPALLHGRLIKALDALNDHTLDTRPALIVMALRSLNSDAEDWHAALTGAYEGALRLAESDAGVVDDATVLARAALTAGELHPAWSGRA